MKKALVTTLMAAVIGGSLQAGGDIAPVVPMPADDSGFYVGGGLAAVSTYGDDLSWFDETSGQDRTGALVGIVGYQFNRYVAVEGRAGFGVITGDFSENYNVSLFVKPMYPVTDAFTVYGLLGYGWVNIDGYHGYPDIASTGSFQWGLGAGYKLDDNWELFADYTWLLHNEDADHPLPDGSRDVSHEMFTVGALYHF